ncbi:LON peptidase substrate-binding domain-containing protein [Thalassomonas haliotis]|uniref:LON peptidase substrate-binding domain-containing protein n=1 Tax=Thalassomonas haliotis TaxID=485448 RepID=A0ABY7VA17_9GAMM|nr:LON peptidase substrate-binding domain-containing protein [Thalassomonas haliotis]WDE10161.1 LON peptidase substrate-binding domain-containing protein [Thalassomonas haliotis]
MKIPIFPLPVYLLPGGITQLRIFEQRYLNMVKNVGNTQGFVIAYVLDDARMSKWGSWVDIIDFDSDEEGLLNITVKCKSLVSISDTSKQADRLLCGTVTPMEHWQASTDRQDCHFLQQQLKWLFNEYEALQQLYQSCYFERDDWVCARWLELLPVKFEDKSFFADKDSFLAAVAFLNVILGAEKAALGK